MRPSRSPPAQTFDVKDGRAVVVGLEGLSLQELYLIEDGAERRLTDLNTTALKKTDQIGRAHV